MALSVVTSLRPCGRRATAATPTIHPPNSPASQADHSSEMDVEFPAGESFSSGTRAYTGRPRLRVVTDATQQDKKATLSVSETIVSRAHGRSWL